MNHKNHRPTLIFASRSDPCMCGHSSKHTGTRMRWKSHEFHPILHENSLIASRSSLYMQGRTSNHTKTRAGRDRFLFQNHKNSLDRPTLLYPSLAIVCAYTLSNHIGTQKGSKPSKFLHKKENSDSRYTQI